jgi:hypothetical protein
MRVSIANTMLGRCPMIRNLGVSMLVAGVLAASAAAQSRPIAPPQYDPSAEVSSGGVITGVISVAGPDGTVGVHLNVKTGTGVIVKVHLGPAMFIGMNNFSFLMDEQVLVIGSFVSHGGDIALWAREVHKDGKTLTLRSSDGTPRWPFATADDLDGCGVSHAPVRY